jgi:hypothetical protein
LLGFSNAKGQFYSLLTGFKFLIRPLYKSAIWIVGDISEIKRSRYFVAIPHLINKLRWPTPATQKYNRIAEKDFLLLIHHKYIKSTTNIFSVRRNISQCAEIFLSTQIYIFSTQIYIFSTQKYFSVRRNISQYADIYFQYADIYFQYAEIFLSTQISIFSSHRLTKIRMQSRRIQHGCFIFLHLLWVWLRE